ncbi:MAG TPA: thioredoxin family protein [Kiritimatiellia bacterium]|nr:thioredoxin family protein [Kiritimatiellia bacterium]
MKKSLIAMSVATLAACAFTVQAAKLEIGAPAPDFTLADTHGTEHSLSDFAGKFVVLEWVNHGCPFVKKFYKVGEMQRLQEEAREKGVVWLKICSSAEGQQGYMTNDDWNSFNENSGVAATATLIDEPGDVGRLFGARVTPHMYIINPDGILIYQGAIDSIRSANSDDIANAKNYVRAALEEAMAGEPVTDAQTEPYGCSVKYR